MLINALRNIKSSLFFILLLMIFHMDKLESEKYDLY